MLQVRTLSCGAVALSACLVMPVVTSAANLSKTGFNRCPKMAVKSGQWTGTYTGAWTGGGVTLPHTLVVADRKSNGRATILYAVGRARAWGINPACHKVTGRFTDKNTLKIDFQNGHRATYDFFDDFVNAKYTSPSGTTRGQVKRVQ